MRILSDFDGVLTAHYAEADALGARHVALMGEALGDAALAAAIFEEMRAQARARPANFGWRSGAWISCYADEDPYAFHNAVAEAIYAEAPAGARAKLAAAGLPSAEAFSIRAWREAEAAFRAANPSHVSRDGLATLGVFAAAGAEVVIVSNSASARVEALLAGAGIGRRFGEARPRVRGDARKFVLAAENGADWPAAIPEARALGGRPVRLRRPHFFEILREETPDVVIGDVLSMDLALPLAMRDAGLLEETTIVLVRHPHTPPFALEACAACGIEVIDSVAKAPRLLRI
jgi:hypothetical protein